MHATREEVEEFLAAFRFAIQFGECRFSAVSRVIRRSTGRWSNLG
jgi:hypothetical protein